MTSKRKLEEKHLQTLKKIQQIECNKKCFECDQRGPTYVDVTIGSFVCTSCGGILRGLNPPHRVKSVSMATFTQTEIAFIQTRGNDYCKNIFMGKYDERSRAKPESRSDHSKLKYFMEQKYEQKKWYIPPEQAAKPLSSITDELQKANEIKPLSSILGKNHTPIQVNKQEPAKVEAPPKAHTDILADFSSDAFGAPSTSKPAGGFADFGNAFSAQPSGFDAFGAFTSGQPASQTQTVPGFGGSNVMTTTNQTPNQPPQKSADKYADLADLFSMDNSAIATPSTAATGTSDLGWASYSTQSSNTQMNSVFGMSPPSYSAASSYQAAPVSQHASGFPNTGPQPQSMPFGGSTHGMSGYGNVPQNNGGFGGMPNYGMPTSNYNSVQPHQQPSPFATSQGSQMFGTVQQGNFGTVQQQQQPQQPFAQVNAAPSNPFMQTAGQATMQAPMANAGNPFMLQQQQNSWGNQGQKPFQQAQATNPFMAAQAQAPSATNPFF